MSANNIKRYSLSKQVSDKLEEKIATGEYKIGDKIPTEIELMEVFDVSRNTIREAIQSLTSAGILVVKQGDGTYVKSSNRFNGCMNMHYEHVSISDIKEARNTFEVAIVQMAAKRRTKTDMERIKKAYALRNAVTNTVRENTKADVDFHMAIAKACHNKIIYDLYQSIAAYVEDHISERNAKTTIDADIIEGYHEELYVAILEQNSDKAKEATKNILKI